MSCQEQQLQMTQTRLSSIDGQREAAAGRLSSPAGAVAAESGGQCNAA